MLAGYSFPPMLSDSPAPAYGHRSRTFAHHGWKRTMKPMDRAHFTAHNLTGHGVGRLRAVFLLRLPDVPRVCRMP